jgi:RNA polymerase sigma factor (sigma-70 family)
VKRRQTDLKSLAPHGESGFDPRRRQRRRDDDDCPPLVDGRSTVEQPPSGGHPPSHPPSSPRDPIAEAFGLSAGDLVVMVQRMVRRASRGITHDLDDAAQETLCRLLEVDAARFDGRRAVTGFVAMRARWTLRDMRRREARRARLDAVDLARCPRPVCPPPEITDPSPDLTPHLARLSDDDRALLQAHDVDGTSLRALAGQWGVSASTLCRRRAILLMSLHRSLRSP